MKLNWKGTGEATYETENVLQMNQKDNFGPIFAIKIIYRLYMALIGGKSYDQMTK